MKVLKESELANLKVSAKTKMVFISTKLPIYSPVDENEVVDYEGCIDAYSLNGEFTKPKLYLRYHEMTGITEVIDPHSFSGRIVGEFPYLSRKNFMEVAERLNEVHVYSHDPQTYYYQANCARRMLEPFQR